MNILNFFKKPRKRKTVKSTKINQSFKRKVRQIQERNKSKLIRGWLNNPVFMRTATRGVNLPPAIQAENLAEIMRKEGLAENNLNEVFIDPIEYRQELLDSIQHLLQRNMNISIYNLPLCLLPKSLWKYSRDSISSWKKFYIEKCNDCNAREKCSGLFETSVVQSKNIKAL